MNRLNKTESAVFNLWMLYFQRIFLTDYSEIDIQNKIARVSIDDKVLLVPLPKLINENILGAKCLVNVNMGKSVMRLINPNDKDIHL